MAITSSTVRSLAKNAINLDIRLKTAHYVRDASTTAI